MVTKNSKNFIHTQLSRTFLTMSTFSTNSNNWLPLLRIQHDWQEDFRNVGKSSFWTSFTDKDKKDTFGKIHVTVHADRTTTCEGEGGFEVANFDKQNHRWIEIASPGKQLCTTFTRPQRSFNLHNKKSVNSVGISPQGSLGVSAGNDGGLYLWQTDDGTVRRTLSGTHVSDVLTCRFFPSGEVVLSGGSDTQLGIWDVMTGECAAVMRGHSGGILDTAIVDRGRNVISCSRDGTARLWECASQATVAVLCKTLSAINACAVCDTTLPAPASTRQKDSREHNTDGKLLILACEDSTLRGIDLSSQYEIFNLNCGSAVNCCLPLGDRLFLAGTQSGTIYLWDAANFSHPVSTVRRTEAAVLSFAPFSATQFVASTADGLCFLWDMQHNQLVREMTGSDYDPIYSIASHSNSVYSACRDGMIYKYDL